MDFASSDVMVCAFLMTPDASPDPPALNAGLGSGEIPCHRGRVEAIAKALKCRNSKRRTGVRRDGVNPVTTNYRES